MASVSLAGPIILEASRCNSGAAMTGWNIGLWMLQVILATIFGLAGWMMLTAQFEFLNALLAWTQGLPEVAVRIIAVLEILGAIGLFLPALLRVMPQLTAYAAAAIAVLMLLATIFHAMRGEVPNLVPTIILCGIAAFIAWGRLVKSPISPRNASA